MKKLNVLMGGRPLGTLTQDSKGRLSFQYTDSWVKFDRNFNLSFSIPVSDRTFEGRRLENFLWNLLPDNEATLKAWGNEFGVSSKNAFALLEKVGEDCAGAVQFVTDEWLSQNRLMSKGQVEWLSEKDVEDRLRRLVENGTWSGRTQSDRGHFSLAGAQPKFALLCQGGKWGVPSGRVATTHIFKPPMPHLNGVTENEHACLQLARRVGLTAAESEVGHFGDQIAIVVKRYDREEDAQGNIRRFHQEDFCQALGVHPANKYQKDGGPSPEQMGQVLTSITRASALDSKERLINGLIFNFLIGGTDAHAKNFSIMHLSGKDGPISAMAPFYDLISYDPYADNPRDLHGLKMAMKVKYYEFEKVMPRHWETLSSEMGVDPEKTIGALNALSHAIPDEMSAIRDRCRSDGLNAPILDKMVDTMAARCERIKRVYGSAFQTDLPKP